MKKLVCTVIMLVLVSRMGFAQSQVSASDQTQAKTMRLGVLLLAHGGSLEWNKEVRHVADQVDESLPTEVAFGMASKSAMQAAVSRLVARGVTEIVTVPLFISSHSSVIDSIAYLLGSRTQQPEDLQMFASMDHSGTTDHSDLMHGASAVVDAAKPISSPVPIHMTPALDHHPIVAEILRDRASSISRDPKREVVILVAHGPVADDENQLWLKDMNILAEDLRQQTHYADIECLTLRDDADDAVRNAATEQLREKVEQTTRAGDTALIVPLLLSYGGIEGGLRERLSGLVYRIPTHALLPDSRIPNWIIDTARTYAE